MAAPTAAAEAAQMYAPRMLIQEALSGQECHLDICNDLNGRVLAVVPKRKLVMRAGETDQAEIVDWPELIDLGTLESPGMAIIDVLQSGTDFELRILQARGQFPVLPPEPLTFDQQAQPIFKIQLADIGLATLFFQGLGHALQA